MRLKGKCRLCGCRVVLAEGNGQWIHEGLGLGTHVIAAFRSALARADEQAAYALAGPSKGSR